MNLDDLRELVRTVRWHEAKFECHCYTVQIMDFSELIQ